MGKLYIGTASWTDKTLIKSGRFYPKGGSTAEARLRFYADHFDTVEVDSSYYAIPAERNAVLWAKRTPEGFIFNIKAYSMLTGHPTLIKGIPRILAAELPPKLSKQQQAREFPIEIVEAAFDMFVHTLRPLQDTGKLGCILFQFPPWFLPSRKSFDWLKLVREKTREMMVAVEFRHQRWIESPDKDKAVHFLKEHGMTFVAVDGPWIHGWAGPGALTSDVAYIRLHGRNRKSWFARGVRTVEKYRYLYPDKELLPWAARVENVAQRAQQTFVLFNNCYADYGVKNAAIFKKQCSSVSGAKDNM